MPDFNDYVNASFADQMLIMMQAIKERQEQLKPENYLFASPVDRMQIMINSITEEQKKIDSGYYLTAPWTEQVAYMARQMQEKIKKETEMKIQEIEFHLKWLNDNKAAVVLLLDRIDKNQTDVGNLVEVNNLLDRMIFLLNEMHKKQSDLNKLTE